MKPEGFTRLSASQHAPLVSLSAGRGRRSVHEGASTDAVKNRQTKADKLKRDWLTSEATEGSDMLTIHHLYADMMNLYGDRGNVISIQKRCEWRGISVEIVDVRLGESIRTTGCDIFLFGGGQDREQALLADDLSGSKGADLRSISEDGGVILGVCGGYQLMGSHYETADGEKLPGVGVFDLHTEPRKPEEARLIGNVLVSVPLEDGSSREIVGFENHGGRTRLGETQPLGHVVSGFGNNGEDGTEGARKHNTYGTYLHGSLLPKNPWFTDMLIESAIRHTDDTFTLEPLDDGVESSAFGSVAARVRR